MKIVSVALAALLLPYDASAFAPPSAPQMNRDLVGLGAKSSKPQSKRKIALKVCSLIYYKLLNEMKTLFVILTPTV